MIYDKFMVAVHGMMAKVYVMLKPSLPQTNWEQRKDSVETKTLTIHGELHTQLESEFAGNSKQVAPDFTNHYVRLLHVHLCTAIKNVPL